MPTIDVSKRKRRWCTATGPFLFIDRLESNVVIALNKKTQLRRLQHYLHSLLLIKEGGKNAHGYRPSLSMKVFFAIHCFLRHHTTWLIKKTREKKISKLTSSVGKAARDVYSNSYGYEEAAYDADDGRCSSFTRSRSFLKSLWTWFWNKITDERFVTISNYWWWHN